MVSESKVNSDSAFPLILAGVEVLPGGRVFAGLAVLVGGANCGDFARTVLGCDPVVEVKSVPSYVSPSLMLEREATRGPAWDVT